MMSSYYCLVYPRGLSTPVSRQRELRTCAVKRAIRFALICVFTGFFDTLTKCFRAG